MAQGKKIDPEDPTAYTVERVAVRLVGDHYHRAPCQGDCFMAFGCAPQWQPDEIERMRRQNDIWDIAPKPLYINKIAAFVGGETYLARAQDIYRGGHTCMNSDMGPPGSCLLCNEKIARKAEAAGPSPDYRRPKTSAERKGEPIHSGVLMYFPDALAAIARLSKTGNDKHNPGEPLHWARGKSTDQMDCVTRHSLTREAIDPEMGEIEAVAMAWRALAELQLLEEKRLNAAGIMPYSGVTT